MAGPTSNSRLEFELTAAKHALRLVSSWEIPLVADRALASGEYSPALAELAMVVNPIMSDVEPLFIAVLAEMGLQVPPRTDAAWFIVRHCMQVIISDAASPREAVSLLIETSETVWGEMPNKHYVGDNLDVAPLVHIHWSYIEPGEICFQGRVITDEPERQAILDSLAREEAQAWLARHPALSS
jgi:hypothetical protein